VSEEIKQGFRKTRSLILSAKTSLEPERFEKFAAALRSKLRLVIVDDKLDLDLDYTSAKLIIEHQKAVRLAARQIDLLRQSTLMAIVSRTEWFVAQLVHLFFRKHPESAGTSEPFFSLESLVSIETIEDAREMLLDQRVEMLMRQSFDDWLRFFREKPKLGMSHLV